MTFVQFGECSNVWFQYLSLLNISSRSIGQLRYLDLLGCLFQMRLVLRRDYDLVLLHLHCNVELLYLWQRTLWLLKLCRFIELHTLLNLRDFGARQLDRWAEPSVDIVGLESCLLSVALQALIVLRLDTH